MTTTAPHPGPAARPVPPALLVPAPRAGTRLPAYALAQPYLTFPTARRPQPSAVLATRVAGLCLTVLAACWPGLFALLAIAFGLGIGNPGGVLFGLVLAMVAVGWPLGFWFGTVGARRVWPVLVALLPTATAAAWAGVVLL